jgi:purine-binding chemotaxis protein CheW
MQTGSVSASAHSSNVANQLCTFFVDNLFFGVDVLSVQEVLRFQHMTRVPRAPQVIEGLINLRGQIVTALDMRRRLRLSPRNESATPMNVVIRRSDGVVSLLVDEIGDVLQVDTTNYEEPPNNLDPETRKIVKSVYKLNDRLLLVLDEERTVTLASEKQV